MRPVASVVLVGLLGVAGCGGPSGDTARPPKDHGGPAGDSGSADGDTGDSETMDSGDSGAGDSGTGDSGTGDSGDTGAGDTADTGSREPLPVCINEWMPDNQSALTDEIGETPDWIELHNPTSEDVDLTGWTLSDHRDTPDRYGFPAGTTLRAGAFLLLYADGAIALGGRHLSFSLDSTGGEVALFAPDGRASLVTYGSVSADFSVARVTDCCTGDGCLGFDFRGTPGVSNEPVVTVEEPLLPVASEWAYWDLGVLPADDWAQPGYDDGAWARGVGPLGYGDAQSTVLSYGADAADKYVTTWFRTSFEAADVAGITGLTLALNRDDGAVVYLNGVEVARSNMPTGTIAEDTYASAGVGDADEVTYFSYGADPGVLVDGTNVVAVEVHQATPDSSDVTFDLGVTAERVE